MAHNSGFTLIELLVVLVITGMTATLLITGLNTTWSNFDRLSQQNLVRSRGQIPKSWFLKSVNAALLGHPEKPLFSGTEKSFTFVSFMAPDDDVQQPKQITWIIQETEESSFLRFSYESVDKDKKTQSKVITVWRFSNSSSVYFEYLVDGAWVTDYRPQKGELPRAIRINNGFGVWVVAAVLRPRIADVPPKMPILGKYEF